MDCTPPDSSVHRIFQARILEWVAISFSSRSSWPRDGTQVSCISGRFFLNWAMFFFVFNCPLRIWIFVFNFNCLMWLVASEGEYISCSSSYLAVLCHVKSGPWYLQTFTELAPSAPSVLTSNIACLERLFPNHFKMSWDSICTHTLFSHSHTDLSHFICRTYCYPKGSCSFIFFSCSLLLLKTISIYFYI